MGFPTRTPAVGSHAGQRHVSSETAHRTTAVPRSATGVSDGRGRGSHPRAMARQAWATREVAAGDLRCDWAHDAITTVAAILGDDVTAAVLVLNRRADVVGVSYATDGLGLLVRHGPSREQR
jgi:hypothetical protein